MRVGCVVVVLRGTTDVLNGVFIFLGKMYTTFGVMNRDIFVTIHDKNNTIQGTHLTNRVFVLFGNGCYIDLISSHEGPPGESLTARWKPPTLPCNFGPLIQMRPGRRVALAFSAVFLAGDATGPPPRLPPCTHPCGGRGRPR